MSSSFSPALLAQLTRIIMYLKESAVPKTPDEIKQATGDDLFLKSSKQLRKAIKKHQRIRLMKDDQDRLRYQVMYYWGGWWC
jgi:TFIIE beta subunit core domain